MSDPWSQFPDAPPAADPWAAFPDAPPAPAAAVPQAPGGTDMPAMARAPGSMGTPEEPGFLARTGRNLMLGTQAVGHGIADLATTPFNMANSAANIGLSGADMVADKVFGGRVPFRFNTQLDENLAGATESAVNAAGIPTFEPESVAEKVLNSGIRFGTQGMLGAAALTPYATSREAAKGMAGAKPQWFDDLVAPYAKAPEAPVLGAGNTPMAKVGNAYLTATAPLRSVQAGDAAAGVGAGMALAGTQRIPEEYRSMGGGTVGTIADFLAMLGGSAGGATIIQALTRGPISVVDKIRASGADANIPLDPETRTPTSRRVADMASEYVKGRAIDPEAAAGNIGREVSLAQREGRPVPTSGMISGDVGVESLERGVRSRQSTDNLVSSPDADPALKTQYNFGARDRQLQDAAVHQADSIRDPGATPRAFTEGVGNVLDDRLAQRTGQANTARAAATNAADAEAALATDINRSRGQDVAASTAIDQTVRETRNAEVQQKNALYNNPELTAAEVPVDPMRQTAGELGAADTPAAPLAPVVRKYVDRFGAIDEGTPITMREVNANRAEIEADIAANLDNGEIVRQLREMKATVNRYADELAATDGPAAEAAAAANANYRERFQPNFRQGAGGQFDRALKAERAGGTPVRPSETAETFLTSPEGTADLMRIAALRGNEQATAEQARTWLFDQLARKSVTQDGRLNPNGLANWQTDNRALLRNIPGLDEEVTQLLVQARNGRALSNSTTVGLMDAEARLRGQQRFNQSSTPGQVARSEPDNAVKAILEAPDPRAAAREVVGTIGFNPEARRGMGAAFADHVLAKVKNTNASALSEGTQPVSYHKLLKEFQDKREALAEVFTPAQMNALQRAQKILEPLGKLRGQATSGSPTAERVSRSTALAMEAGLKLFYGGLKGGGIWRSMKLAASAFGGDEGAQIERLVARMMFDPELAQHLLTRNTREVATPAWNAKLQKIIRYNEVGSNALSGEDEPTTSKGVQ